MENITEAKMWLEIAIRRHERHMKGTEPTTGTDGEISQNLMMEEMKYALSALVDGFVLTSSWYDENIKKFPDMPSDNEM
jgi:type VI protein secretion system component VasF